MYCIAAVARDSGQFETIYSLRFDYKYLVDMSTEDGKMVGRRMHKALLDSGAVPRAYVVTEWGDRPQGWMAYDTTDADKVEQDLDKLKISDLIDLTITRAPSYQALPLRVTTAIGDVPITDPDDNSIRAGGEEGITITAEIRSYDRSYEFTPMESHGPATLTFTLVGAGDLTNEGEISIRNGSASTVFTSSQPTKSIVVVSIDDPVREVYQPASLWGVIVEVEAAASSS